MKRFVTALIALTSFVAANAQAPREAELPAPPEGYRYVDSLIFTPLAYADSTLDGRSIFRALPENVLLSQSSLIRSSVDRRVEENRGKLFKGYRVRIFFDNGQYARANSIGAQNRFKAAYPGIPTYYTYENSNFKVTVGDFRNKSEAAALLQKIKRDFPDAFVVRESFRFPSLENQTMFRIDTVKVLRPID